MNYLCAIMFFVAGEIMGLVIFPIITRTLGPKGLKPFDSLSIFKGVLERLVLFIALLNNIPQILIAFSAMKIATRLHEDTENQISNAYFLVGNLLSILIAVIAVILTKHLCMGQ